MGISKLNPSAGGIPFGNTAGRPTAATGKLYSNGETARLELYTSAGVWENIVQEVPGVSSISGNYSEQTNSGTITINGTNFVSGAIASAIGTNGVEVLASSTTYNSLVQLTCVFNGLSNANEPYDIKVTNPSNLFGMLIDLLYVNASPAWTTTAGSLGTFAEQVAMSVSATATDDSTLTYSLASGSSLPAGVTLNSSTGLISGTPPDVASNTTYTFTINASDGVNAVVPRTFSFISNAAPVWVTNAGTLGTFAEQSSITISALSATDSTDTVTYALASGSTLPSGVTLNSSSGVISGTLPDVASNTTYTFTINASDGLGATARQFSITSNILTNISTAETLVIGGGGGGGSNGNTTGGGGGGAGGYIYNASTSFAPGTAYTLSIGTGGVGRQQSNSSPSSGSKGGSSSISGSGFSTITAAGGGGGASNQSGGKLSDVDGASGGGGNYNTPPGSGTVGQGNAGANGEGINATWVSFGGGGGGGSAATPSQPATGFGGTGGIGTANSITGTSLYYAAGGGGGVRSGYTAGLGGSSIGGNGVVGTGAGGNASPANRGSGGGGGGGDGNNTGYIGGTGSDGVIVIAYPNSVVTPTISAGLTYDQPTRSGYRVYRFTAGSGTVTF
jgi:Putative Ig domain